MGYQIVSPFEPQGDQPQAINSLVRNFQNKENQQVLLGVTGSGKTFTMANIISRLDCPALVIAPNKTLASQLYLEFKEFFPRDPVGFFISYYDYFQPEAYVPTTDTYIAKDSSINDDIDKMRHEATRILFENPRAIIIASVSCIYGLGSPQAYAKKMVKISVGDEIERDVLLQKLVEIHYDRNDYQLERGHFRVRGDIVDLLPSHQTNEAVRISFFGDEIETIDLADPLTGNKISSVNELCLYPNSHYVTEENDMKKMTQQIKSDLADRLHELESQNKLVEKQRLEQRTNQDIETLEETGMCPGIENYTRYLTGKAPGEPPPCLLDYFPKDFLIIADESHITIPQLRAMYRGDRARKDNLVNYGFRLPAARDNRPLNFNEFLERTDKLLCVSATPGAYEYEVSRGAFVEQLIRPTGLLDPIIEQKPTQNQVDDLLTEIKKVISNNERILVTTLTKKMAEELCEYYAEHKIKVRYLHSDISTLERTNILKDFRSGVFDVLIGINLLREGLDLPEVQLVAILDADKEGFLRSETSLIQTAGRAARNINGRVLFYGDKTTDAIAKTMKITRQRRENQLKYNQAHGITAQTIKKQLPKDLRALYGLPSKTSKLDLSQYKNAMQLEKDIKSKSKEMKAAAKQLDFETAATLRDEITQLKEILLAFGEL